MTKSLERFKALCAKKVEKGKLTEKEEGRLSYLRDLVEVQKYIRDSKAFLVYMISVLEGEDTDK